MKFSKNERGHHISDCQQYEITGDSKNGYVIYNNGKSQDASKLSNAKRMCELHKAGDKLLFN